MLNFHTQPGPHERQLRRKYENPLLASGQGISQIDVDKAREQDQAELEAFLDDFRQSVEQAANLDSRAEADDILAIKARLEQLYPRACGQMGESGAFKSALQRLITAITQALLKAAGNDQESLSRIHEDIENSELHLKISEFPLVADLLSNEEIVPANELAATLLGEESESLSAALLIFGPEQLQKIIETSKQLLAGNPQALSQHPEFQQRLELIEEWFKGLLN